MRNVSRLVALFTALGLTVNLLGSDALVSADNPRPDTGETERLIIRFKPGVATVAADAFPGDNGCCKVDSIPGIGAIVVSVPRGEASKAMAAYRALEEIASVEPDCLAYTAEVPDDASFSQQWGMTKIKAPEAWNITKGSPSVTVAILDTGMDIDHPDLASKIVLSRNFTDSPTDDDRNGHGSHTAGIAAAVTGNGVGVAGVGYNVRLINAKVLGDSGSGYYSSIINGIIWAADNGADVISMSIGGGSGSADMEDAINYAWNKGALVVAAAGNNGSSSPSYPAYYQNSIAVGATDQNDNPYSFSNYGDWVDVAAPGNAYSTYKDGGYVSMSGTSMATPFVSGLAGLVFSVAADKNGNGRTNDEVRDIIETTCDPVSATGMGRGRINALKAVSGANPPVTNGTISGTVTDAATGQGVPGARVTDGTRSATTGLTGNYTIANVPAGTYTVTAVAEGYDGKSLSANVTAAKMTTADFSLSKTVTSAMWIESITFTPSVNSLLIKVKAASPSPVSGARMRVGIDYNGRDHWVYGITEASGEATFQFDNAGSGKYTVTVQRLTHYDYTWDTAKGIESGTYSK